jgi:hypothetical protein
VQEASEKDRRCSEKWGRWDLNPIYSGDISLRARAEIKSYVCAKCGEFVAGTRTVLKDEKMFCLPCAGAEYYQFDWSGISFESEGN